MKSVNVEVLFPDNDGICLHIPGPTNKGGERKGKLYVSKETTPQAIGELFLTLYADVKLDAANNKLDLDNIDF